MSNFHFARNVYRHAPGAPGVGRLPRDWAKCMSASGCRPFRIEPVPDTVILTRLIEKAQVYKG